MQEWHCDCPICRVLVKRIINRAKSSPANSYNVEAESTQIEGIEPEKKEKEQQGIETINIKELEQRFPVESVKLSEEPKDQQQVIEQKQEEKIEEENNKKELMKVQVEVPREVIDRIEQLENEISKIKKYVKASIDGIKAVLVDLRSTMAELSNPFNILRKYADIFFGREEEQTSLGRNLRLPSTLPKQLHMSGSKPEADKVVTKETEESEEPKRSKKLDLDTYSKLAEWVDLVLQKIPAERLSEIINSYVEVGIINQDLGDTLKKIVKIVEELKKHGVDVKEQKRVLAKLIEDISSGSLAERDVRSDLLDLIKGE